MRGLHGQVFEGFVEFVDREADDVGVVAVDAGDKAGEEALDGVGARFVVGFGRREIPVQFLAGDWGDVDDGFGVILKECVVGGETESSQDDVRAAGQGFEHLAGVLRISGFFKDLVIDDDDGVGAEGEFARLADGERFVAGEAQDVIKRRFGRFAELGNLGGANQVGDARGGKEFAAAGGLAREDEHALPMLNSRPRLGEGWSASAG